MTSPRRPLPPRFAADSHTSRRDFMGTTMLAVGGTPLLLGCEAMNTPSPRAAPRAPLGPEDPIKIGFIGVGGMGTGHLRNTLSQVRGGRVNAQIVAVADVAKPRVDRALSHARKQDGVEVEGYSDYKKVLAREDIHCVLIASPEHWHAQMAVDAIAAGKDVYLEKPMTLRLKDALWLKQTVDKNPDMRVQIGTQYMMRKKYHHARKLIKDGIIGHPVTSQTSYCRNRKDGEWLYKIDERIKPGETLDWDAWCGPLGQHEWSPEIYHRWRRYRDFSTGIIGDLLVHQMTPLMFATDAGWPVRVTASGGHYVDKAMENHDQVTLTVEFEGEHTMSVAGATCNEKGLVEMIRGHKANILLGSNNCVMQPERIWVDDVDGKTFKCEKVREQPELRLDWLDCVRSRKQNFSQVDLATKVMVIVDLATRSMWSGSAFKFDHATMTVEKA